MKINFLAREFERRALPGLWNTGVSRCWLGTQLISLPPEEKLRLQEFNYTVDTATGQQGLEGESINTWRDYEQLESYQNIILAPGSKGEDNYPVWQIEINCEELMLNYLLARCYQQQVFQNIPSNQTRNNNLISFQLDFVREQLYNRFRLKSVDWYIYYLPISVIDGVKPLPQYQSLVRFLDLSLEANLNRNVNITWQEERPVKINVFYTMEELNFEFSFYYEYQLTYELI